MHVPVIAAHNVSSKPGGEPGVVAGLCEAAHLSPRLVGGGALGFCGPCFCSDNPVSDAARKHVRPLLHGLVTDANRLGCGGDRTPEIIDCSLFAHAVLNHSSCESATIDQPVGEKIKTMVDASERLNLAMTHAGVDARALAKMIGVTYQAIKKAVDGKTKSLSAENCAKAARAMGVDHLWLAIGEGQMIKPVGRISLDDIIPADIKAALINADDEALQVIDGVLRSLLKIQSPGDFGNNAKIIAPPQKSLPM